MVDPATDITITKSCDVRYGKHPLQHAVMVAIDQVASTQGGGMWQLPGKHCPISIHLCKQTVSEGIITCNCLILTATFNHPQDTINSYF